MLDYGNLAPINRSYRQIEKSLSDYAVLPIYGNTKVCATKHGYKSAAKNAPVAEWLNRGYNLAISLPLSYLVCIDVDMHRDIDGLKAFKELVEKLGSIQAYTELTATNGGLHIFVSKEGLKEDLKNCDLAPGVELKINSYIVCAPSIYNGNSYKIVNGINANGTYQFPKLNDKWLNFINSKADNKAKSTELKQYNTRKFIPSDVPLKYAKMLENCRLLRYMYENPDDILEPVWFSVISMLTRNANTDEFIHLISQGHSNYTAKETNYKIERNRKTDKHRGCYYMANNHYEYCKGCPKAEQIKRRYNNGK